MKEYLPPSYTDNDWLVPIRENTRNALVSYSPEDAVRIAYIVHQGKDTCALDIGLPFTVGFKSEGIGAICERLQDIITTPDDPTQELNPSYLPGIDGLSTILRSACASEGVFAAHASYAMVQVAAGKPEERWFSYVDHARLYPQYATAWIDNLISQFGEDQVLGVFSQHRELFELLGRVVLVAEQRRANPFLEGESVPDGIKLSLNILNINDLDSLQAAIASLQAGLIPYREQAYALRGLIYNGQS